MATSTYLSTIASTDMDFDVAEWHGDLQSRTKLLIYSIRQVMGIRQTTNQAKLRA